MTELTNKETLQPAEEDAPGGAPAPADPSRARRLLAIAFVVYALYGVLLPLVRVSLTRTPRWEIALGSFIATLVFMLLLLWVPWSLAVARPRTRLALGLGLVMLALYPGILFLEPRLLPSTLRHAPWLVHGLPLTGLWQAAGFGLVGIALSYIVREAKILLPLGLVLGLIDIVGAMMPVGFTSNVIASHPEVVRAVSVPVPTVGSLAPSGYVGPGDALFLGFFFSLIDRLNMNRAGTFWLTYIFLTVTMVLVLIFGFNVAALFPMGLAVIFANIRYFRYSREEAFAMLYAGAITLMAAVGFFLYTNHHIFHH